ncbi:MAG TPA: RNA-binding protein, partial [Puia sp.]|nr:RNA-binding protein [Puia sp.]
VGRYDAMNGLFLKGDGKGNFAAESILQSGIFIPGNGKALVKLRGSSGNCLLAAGQNRGALKIFQLKQPINCLPLLPSDVSGIIKYKNGSSRKQEFYFGESFLSESGRFLIIDDKVAALELTDNKGNKRRVPVK